MFHSAREEELLYVLRKLLGLRLWSGSLWAAFSEAPSRYCLDLPGNVRRTAPHDTTIDLFTVIDQTLGAPSLIADAIKRSTKAHLFHFYPILCEIVAIPRKTPTAWVMESPKTKVKHGPSKTVVAAADTNEGEAVALDARALVKECLQEIGREMGVGQ